MSKLKRVLRCFAAMTALLAVLTVMPSTVAHAESDVDFTVQVDVDKEYIAGNIIEAPILIATQTDNGYVEMTMLLKYNQDALTCNSIYDDVNGFTTTIVDDGLQIFYQSPDGQKSPIDTYKLDIKFTVKTGVASGKYSLELVVDVNDVYGYDKNGNKEKGLLTISDARTKELTIIETGDGVTTAGEDGSEANFYTGIATTTQAVQNKSGGCSSVGAVFACIIGAIVIFIAGVIVGFLLCQKRMNDEGFYMNSGFGGSGGISENRPHGAADSSGGDSVGGDDGYGMPSSRGSGSIYDSLSEDYAAKRSEAAKAAQQRTPASEDDSRVDTSYFGKAAGQRLGENSDVAFDEDDDDDFPDVFKPRRYSSNSSGGNRFSEEFDSLLGQNRRRAQNDDGYGSFTIDNEDEPIDENDSYRSDRRRYR